MYTKKYTLSYHKKVIKFLKKHPEIHKRFFKNIQELQKNPYIHPNSKALENEEKGSFRLRIGDYRFKYIVIEEKIVIYFYDAGSRGDIYKS
ncbi:MAG: hypothetical protein CR971_00795 [candidate division SR1 bacterium]|nr:MAG: hypothetical protein CR971_00795 [candidate division SR1 bacterium]